MKNLKFLLVIILFYGCVTEDDLTPCVEEEVVVDTVSGFMIFDKGNLDQGIASGLKINLPFEAGVYINIYENTDTPHKIDSIFDINLRTFWSYPDGEPIIAELIRIKGVNLIEEFGCYDLTKNETSADSIYADYRVFHGDTKILDYELNELDVNKLEIISFDLSTRYIKAKLKVSFESDTALLPEFPKNVRFFNVNIDN